MLRVASAVALALAVTAALLLRPTGDDVLPSIQPLVPQASCDVAQLYAAVQRFSRMLQFPTVSDAAAPSHMKDPETFIAQDAFLRDAYGGVFSALVTEKVRAMCTATVSTDCVAQHTPQALALAGTLDVA